MPKISIVAPVYGVEKFIHQFLDSIKNQTFQDFEVILVDDGSPDNCPQILDIFAKSEPRCKVIHQKNAGVSAARNTGISYISGEYVYIVDSDDWLENNALEVLWAEATKNHADIIYGDWIKEKDSVSIRQWCFPNSFSTQNPETIRALQFAVNNNNKVLISRPEFSEIRHLGGAPWRGMIRSNIIKQNNLLFDPYVKGLGDDILFMLHLYEYIKKVSYIDKPIYHYRILSSSYTRGYKADYLESVSRIFDKQEEFLINYHKDDFTWSSYYTRVMIYLGQGMERFFVNKASSYSLKQRYHIFLDTVSKEPYKTAILKAPIKYMGSKGIRIGTLLLRYRMRFIYWALYLLKGYKNI